MIGNKGMYIWNVRNTEGGNPGTIARLAVEAGLSHVLVKIADGTGTLNVRDGIDQARFVIDALRGVGVTVWGWQYVYGHNPAGEADIAIRRCLELSVDGFVVNAEVEYKHRPRQAAAYMSRLRNGVGGLPIGLSTYRFPSFHREFPFNQFLELCDVNMPQVYWMQASNAGAQLRASIAEYRGSQFVQRPIIPTGAAFREHGWQPTPGQVREFLTVAKELCAGANFWVWEHTRRIPELWDEIQSFNWAVTVPTPAPFPSPTPAPTGYRYRVLTDTLNVRRMPSARGNTPIRQLRKGDVVNLVEVAGSDVWIEIAPGEYCAVRLGNVKFLGRVE